MASLKEQKEAFVTGHSGTTLEEILLITASSPIGVGFYYCVLCLLTYLNGGSKAKLMTRGVVEFFFILLPMILCQTIFFISNCYIYSSCAATSNNNLYGGFPSSHFSVSTTTATINF